MSNAIEIDIEGNGYEWAFGTHKYKCETDVEAGQRGWCSALYLNHQPARFIILEKPTAQNVYFEGGASTRLYYTMWVMLEQTGNIVKLKNVCSDYVYWLH
jgi:hypothetical protein